MARHKKYTQGVEWGRPQAHRMRGPLPYRKPTAAELRKAQTAGDEKPVVPPGAPEAPRHIAGLHERAPSSEPMRVAPKDIQPGSLVPTTIDCDCGGSLCPGYDTGITWKPVLFSGVAAVVSGDLRPRRATWTCGVCHTLNSRHNERCVGCAPAAATWKAPPKPSKAKLKAAKRSRQRKKAYGK
jgi:hypothetical protein